MLIHYSSVSLPMVIRTRAVRMTFQSSFTFAVRRTLKRLGRKEEMTPHETCSLVSLTVWRLRGLKRPFQSKLSKVTVTR